MYYKKYPSNYTRCEKCKHIDRDKEECRVTNDKWLVPDDAGTCHQFEGVNMKVKCIQEAFGLTLNKVYEVMDKSALYYKIERDNGIPWLFLKDRFEIVEDATSNKFEESMGNVAEVASKCSVSAEEVAGKMEKAIAIAKGLTGEYSNVEHPNHYNKGIEAIDYIESWNMDFNIGNVVKYVSRAKYKANELEDLQKAKWYLDREIERVKANA